jgi:hypothetical protein
MRFHFHASFTTVALGCFLFAPSPSWNLLFPLAACWLCFNVLVYGGLYTFNDVVDAAEDARHPVKRARPIPSGTVSRTGATVFAFSLIGAGLALGHALLPGQSFWTLPGFIALNLLYTLVTKRIPHLGLGFVAATHTLRLVLGASLSGHIPDPAVIASFWLGLFALATTIHSTFHLKAREIPRYPPRIVSAIQAVSLATAAAFLWFAPFRQALPVALFAAVVGAMVMASKVPRLRPMVGAVFQVVPSPDLPPEGVVR